MLYHVYWCTQALRWLVLRATTVSQTTIRSYENEGLADAVADILNNDDDLHARAMLVISRPSLV